MLALGNPDDGTTVLGKERSGAAAMAGIANGTLMGGGEPETGTPAPGEDSHVFHIPLVAQAAAIPLPKVIVVDFNVSPGTENLPVDCWRAMRKDYGVNETRLDGNGETTAIGRTYEEPGAEPVEKTLFGLVVDAVAVEVSGGEGKGEEERQKEADHEQ